MLKIFKNDTLGVEEEIKRFEKEHKISFPEIYKKFLMKYNGGDTPRCSFKMNGVSSDISGFYGLRNVHESSELSTLINLDFYLENGVVPIGSDSLGNGIVIGVRKEKCGKIYFYDHETGRFKHLADDFMVFIEKIKSEKFVVRSIEERARGVKEVDSNFELDGDWINLWQEEIDYFSGRQQEIVEI